MRRYFRTCINNQDDDKQQKAIKIYLWFFNLINSFRLAALKYTDDNTLDGA